MKLQDLFNDYVKSKLHHDELKIQVSTIKSENKLNIRMPSQEVSIEDAQKILDKKTYNKQIYSDFENSQKQLNDAYQNLKSAIGLVDKVVHISYSGKNHQLFISQRGDLIVKGPLFN